MSEPLSTDQEDAPIGHPLTETRTYVLDHALNPCPIGVTGELYVAGAGIADGYWNRPALTAERFVANPLAPGERLYRTGDLAAWRADGNLIFRGRADDQIKIRGFRIEPAESAAALSAHPEVSQAAVIVRQDDSGEPYLAAYFVPGPGCGADPASLLIHLKERLPDYMVPRSFVELAALPLTASGKLDRNALPTPDQQGITVAYVAPSTPEEALLCELIGELLGQDRIGTADHFFHLGGDSLMAVRLAARVHSRLDRELPIQTIFEHPVVADLATRIGLVTEQDAAFEPLLPLRTEGSGSPLFCLHPGTGLGWAYANLVRAIPNEYPVYGIQAAGFDGRSLPASLSDIVQHTVEHMRRRQPQGPYMIAGWSFGGLIAHLTATYLQEAGEAVERLILFDSYPPDSVDPLGRDTTAHQPMAWRELALAGGLMLPTDMPDAALDASSIRDIARQQMNVFGYFDIEHLERMAAVLANNSRLAATATLQPFHGDMLLFIATQNTLDLDRSRATPNLWHRYLTGRLHTVDVNAEHQLMMTPDAVAQMQSVLSRL